MIIIGAGVNHWYHNNLTYRAPITALLLCGCCGVNGGGMNHYVGQEKLAPVAPWASLAFALDWAKPPRQQKTPTWHYVHSDQWRYDAAFTEYDAVPPGATCGQGARRSTSQAQAVRLGWMPFFPQFDRNPSRSSREAEAAGAKTDAEIVQWIGRQLRGQKLALRRRRPGRAGELAARLVHLARQRAHVERQGARVSSCATTSARTTTCIAEEVAEDTVETVTWREPAPRGKMDLVVDLNFRMDTSALYSDIVLPAATWYEKNDLNTTDLHSFIHPLRRRCRRAGSRRATGTSSRRSRRR